MFFNILKLDSIVDINVLCLDCYRVDGITNKKKEKSKMEKMKKKGKMEKNYEVVDGQIFVSMSSILGKGEESILSKRRIKEKQPCLMHRYLDSEVRLESLFGKNYKEIFYYAYSSAVD